MFKRLGFSLAREQYEAVANADAGAIERVLKHTRARLARFQQQHSSCRPRSQAAAAADGADSPPDSPAGQLHGLPPGGGAAGAIAALRLGEQPCEPAGPCFQSFGAALEASLADKEQQLEELRETNEVRAVGARLGSCRTLHGWRGWAHRSGQRAVKAAWACRQVPCQRGPARAGHALAACLQLPAGHVAALAERAFAPPRPRFWRPRSASWSSWCA